MVIHSVRNQIGLTCKLGCLTKSIEVIRELLVPSYPEHTKCTKWRSFLYKRRSRIFVKNQTQRRSNASNCRHPREKDPKTLPPPSTNPLEHHRDNNKTCRTELSFYKLKLHENIALAHAHSFAEKLDSNCDFDHFWQAGHWLTWGLLQCALQVSY